MNANEDRTAMNPSAPRNARRTIVTLLALLALAGCAPRVRGPIEPREDLSPWPQIMLADRDLARRIAVRRPIVERDPAGLLFVTVPVRSTTRHQITIEYRSTFYDHNHTPIFQSTWFPVTMTPFTQQTIGANSTSNRAEDFQIDIRAAQ
jgi:uncharacterized protein YcfL